MFSDFEPTNKYELGASVLKAGTAYYYTSHSLSFVTNTRKLFSTQLIVNGDQYFSEKNLSFKTSLSYCWQPYGVFSLTANYTRIRLPADFSKADFWIISPKSGITFTRNLSWTTFTV